MPPGARPPMGPPPPPSPFPGLLYTEGRDALGRAVVVLNTAMLPPKSAKVKKEDILQYVLQQLMPVVQQVRAGLGEGAGGRAVALGGRQALMAVWFPCMAASPCLQHKLGLRLLPWRHNVGMRPSQPHLPATCVPTLSARTTCWWC